MRTHTRDHGYPINHRKPSANGGEIILANRTDRTHQPYVVWHMYADGCCEGGDYCDTLAEAKAAFVRRR